MPIYVPNTWHGATPIGEGLSNIAKALFLAGATPLQKQKFALEERIGDAQIAGLEADASLRSEQRRMLEQQLYARSEPQRKMTAAYQTGQPLDIVDVVDKFYRTGGPRPMMPGAAQPAPWNPAPPITPQAPTRTAAVNVPAAMAGGPEVRGFAPQPIPSTRLGSPAVDPVNPADLIAAQGGSYNRPTLEDVILLSRNHVQAPSVGVRGTVPGASTPDQIRQPYIPALYQPVPTNTAQIAGPPVSAPQGPISGQVIGDEIIRRIGAALATGQLVAQDGPSLNQKSVADAYQSMLTNRVREEALAGRLTPGEAAGRITASEGGKPLYGHSPEGVFGMYDPHYTDVSSPKISAEASERQARSGLYQQQALTEPAKREELESRARRNDRMPQARPAGAGAGAKPKALSSTQRKALDAALEIKAADIIANTSGAADDSEFDADFRMAVRSRAEDLMRDPEGDYFDDPNGAIDAAVEEIAPGGFEASGNWSPAANRIGPKKIGGVEAEQQPADVEPRPAAAVGPRPNVDDAQLIQQARAAIKAGANPDEVNARLKAWGVRGQ